jgi:hypothetical protein
MKSAIAFLLLLCALPPATAQIQRAERKSLLNTDPEVVYLEEMVKKPIILKVTKEAPVYSDKEGRHRLGFLRADQKVELEAMTDKVYRVRGDGTRHGIAGWVAPWAFSSADPEFVDNLKKLYARQIEVQALIAAREIAIGMTLDEVSRSLGKPTKTSVRRTAAGQAGRWEFTEFDEVKHYITRIDPATGQVFRQLSHVTREEIGKTTVEFEDEVVTAIEQSESREGGRVRIVVPPLIFRW